VKGQSAIRRPLSQEHKRDLAFNTTPPKCCKERRPPSSRPIADKTDCLEVVTAAIRKVFGTREEIWLDSDL